MVMQHLLCRLVILAASVFELSCGKTRQTDRQTPVQTLPPQLPSVWVTKHMMTSTLSLYLHGLNINYIISAITNQN